MIISSPLDACPACSHTQDDVSFRATHYYRPKHSQLCQKGKYGSLKWEESSIPAAFIHQKSQKLDFSIQLEGATSLNSPLLSTLYTQSVGLFHTVNSVLISALSRLYPGAQKCTSRVSIILFWQTISSLDVCPCWNIPVCLSSSHHTVS